MQLGVKQILVLIPATAMVGALALFGTFAESRRTLTQEFDVRLHGVLETGAVALAVPLAIDDGESVAAVVKELGRSSDVVCVAATATRDKRSWRVGSDPCGDGLVYLATPVQRGGKAVGNLELWYSLARIEVELAKRVEREALLIFFLCLAVAAAGLAVQTFFVRRPLVRFLKAVRASQADGQLRQADWSSSDELGTVVAAYNQLTLAFEARSEEQRRNAKELWLLANHDQLTGLSNRRYFIARAEEEFAYALRQGEPLSLLMIDIDHFKRINDTHGHDCGDEVLRRLAALFRIELRTEDVCARLGGEEFAILLRHTNIERATEIAERIRAHVELTTIRYADRDVRFTVSTGIADALDGGDRTLTRALSVADRALYRAKNGGRNCIVVGGQADSDKLSLKLVWDGEFASGHPQIDGEHEMLIDSINRIVRHIQQREAQDVVLAEFKAILDALAVHFRHEEQILGSVGWAGLAEHCRLHTSLNRNGIDLYERALGGENCVAEILDFLVREIVGDHLAHEDSSYFPDLSKAIKQA
jgi:diguanylate cyclase (GGDEF)-like protein/hemerythrin-like metal-binding protein